MDIKATEIVLVSPAELVPYSKNANKHPPEQIDRLIKLIEYQGFRDPLIIQKGTNIVVAGHGRLAAAKKMGIDKIPVTYQEFESEAQMYSFMVSHNAIADWAELDLSSINTEMLDLGPDFDVDLLGIEDFVIDPNGNGLSDSIYTDKITAPIYTPTGENPHPTSLYNSKKTDDLIKQIKAANLPDDVKCFLTVAAHRHTVFDFQKIAEFYAHADPALQDLMERSALVIIDFNKAIEHGFIQMTKDLAGSYPVES